MILTLNASFVTENDLKLQAKNGIGVFYSSIFAHKCHYPCCISKNIYVFAQF